MKPVVRRTRARHDILRTAFRIAEEDRRAAGRFLDSVETTLARLRVNDRLGPRRTDLFPPWRRTRSILVDGFANHVIFYVPTKEAIIVLRVLDGRQDLAAVLFLNE